MPFRPLFPGHNFRLRPNGGGYLGLGQIISSAIGPGLGVAIMNQFDVRYSFFVAAAFAFVGLFPLVLFVTGAFIFYMGSPRKGSSPGRK